MAPVQAQVIECVFRERYSDFVVREVGPDGAVARVVAEAPPADAPDEAPAEEAAATAAGLAALAGGGAGVIERSRVLTRRPGPAALPPCPQGRADGAAPVRAAPRGRDGHGRRRSRDARARLEGRRLAEAGPRRRRPAGLAQRLARGSAAVLSLRALQRELRHDGRGRRARAGPAVQGVERGLRRDQGPARRHDAVRDRAPKGRQDGVRGGRARGAAVPGGAVRRVLVRGRRAAARRFERQRVRGRAAARARRGRGAGGARRGGRGRGAARRGARFRELLWPAALRDGSHVERDRRRGGPEGGDGPGGVEGRLRFDPRRARATSRARSRPRRTTPRGVCEKRSTRCRGGSASNAGCWKDSCGTARTRTCRPLRRCPRTCGSCTSTRGGPASFASFFWSLSSGSDFDVPSMRAGLRTAREGHALRGVRRVVRRLLSSWTLNSQSSPR